MAEYIEREEVMKTARDGYHSDFGRSIADLTSLKEVLEDTPVADVVEVRHGEWKPKHWEGGIFDGKMFDECSICGYERFFDDIRFKTTFNYCPNCGAKMDGKEQE